MRSFRLVLVTAFLLIVSPTWSQTISYNDFGVEAFLEISDSTIMVEVIDDSDSLFAALYSKYPALDSTYSPQKLTGQQYKFRILPATDLNGLLVALNADSLTIKAAPAVVSTSGEELFLTNRFLIEAPTLSAVPAMINDLAVLGLTAKPFTNLNERLYFAQFGPGAFQDYVQLFNGIDTLTSIRYFVPSLLFPIQFFYTPNDPFWAVGELYLHQPKQDLERGYDFNLGNNITRICFFDDGIEDHEDWPQPFDISCKSYVDPFEPMCSTDPIFGWHAMAVVGVTYGQIDNNTGIAGFNNANFEIRVHQIAKKESTSPGFADDFSIALAINDAVDSGYNVLNHSWGRPCLSFSGVIANAIQAAYDNGVLTVAAAGNCTDPSGCGCIAFPANQPNVLTVGGLARSDDSRHSESSFGTELDVMGYYKVITLDLMGTDGGAKSFGISAPCNGGNKNYICAEGTSFCAPQAAAIAGMVMAKNTSLIGNPEKVIEVLRYSTDDGGPSCTVDSSFDLLYGYGRLDVYRALLAVARGDVNNSGDGIDISDLTYLVNFMFSGGLPPMPDLLVGDLNCDCSVDIADLDYLVAYMFGGGPAPIICYKY